MDWSYLSELGIRVGTIYGGILLGFLLQQVKSSNEIKKWFTFVGVNIFTPLLLVFTMLGIDDAQIAWGYIILVVVFSSLISLLIDFIFIHNKEDMSMQEKGAELSAVSFSNALFYPFPIILALVGENGLLAASIFLILNTVLRNTLGVYIGLFYGTKTDKSIFKILLGMILFPPTLGMILGIILRLSIGKIQTADVMALNIFRDITMILMLALVGLSFNIPKKEEWKKVAIGRGITSRFGGGALIASLTLILPLPSTAKMALFIQSIAPPAVNNAAYAEYFGLDTEITSRYITLLTLIALLFLPLEVAFLLWIQPSL